MKGKMPPQFAKHAFQKKDASGSTEDSSNTRKSGQDSAILGRTSGKAGGHAGYGQPGNYGTEAMEEASDRPEPITKQEGELDSGAGGSQTSSGAERMK